MSTFAKDLCLHILGGCDVVPLDQGWGVRQSVKTAFGTMGPIDQALFPREDTSSKRLRGHWNVGDHTRAPSAIQLEQTQHRETCVCSSDPRAFGLEIVNLRYTLYWLRLVSRHMEQKRGHWGLVEQRFLLWPRRLGNRPITTQRH